MDKSHGNSSMQAHQGNAGQNQKPREMTDAESALERFENCKEGLDRVNDRLMMLAQRLAVGSPESASDQQAKPVRGGIIGKIRDQGDDIQAQIISALDKLSAIERVI